LAFENARKAYLAKLPVKPTQSLLVSLADKTHNAEATLYEYRVLGEPLWQRFNGGAEGTRWYYGALADVFSQKSPDDCRIGSRGLWRPSRLEHTYAHHAPAPILS
jgi:hypothetical protein